MGDVFIKVLPDGFAVLLAPAAALPALVPMPVPVVAPVVVPVAAPVVTPLDGAELRAFWASAAPLVSASAVANPIVAIFITVLLVLQAQETRLHG